jgi:hypothetical protein
LDDRNVIEFGKRKKARENEKSGAHGKAAGTKANQGEIVIENGFKVYRNNFFGLEVSVPDSWISLDNGAMLELAKAGFERLELSEDDRNELLHAVTEDNISLFRATPYPNGTRQPYGGKGIPDNPVINCTALRIALYPNRTAKDFVDEMVEIMKSGRMGISYEEVRSVTPVIISGKRFDSVEGKALVNGNADAVVRTRYYSILKKGYQISILATCVSGEGYDDLTRIVNNIHLD